MTTDGSYLSLHWKSCPFYTVSTGWEIIYSLYYSFQLQLEKYATEAHVKYWHVRTCFLSNESSPCCISWFCFRLQSLDGGTTLPFWTFKIKCNHQEHIFKISKEIILFLLEACSLLLETWMYEICSEVLSISRTSGLGLNVIKVDLTLACLRNSRMTVICNSLSIVQPMHLLWICVSFCLKLSRHPEKNNQMIKTFKYDSHEILVQTLQTWLAICWKWFPFWKAFNKQKTWKC